MRHLIVFFSLITILSACHKGNTDVQPTKPGLGTTFTYIHRTFKVDGSVYTKDTVTYRVTELQTIGSDSWLVLRDTAQHLVWTLLQKSDGLYQYSNNQASLLCKDPTTVGDTYSSAGTTTFVTVTVSGQLGVPYGVQTVNYYEGKVGANIMDKIWYNSKVFFARRDIYSLNLVGIYYLNERFELYSIKY
jgi:hypothetical protein